jgi:hypothetical protein|tara:strand:- start:179 stop:394 length:216 start_codon:yes stop_codon:yes gene_type:complete
MKFIMLMYICSHIAGNECKLIPTPVVNFNTYSECAIYGYEYSTILLKEFDKEFVNTYRAYTLFDCKETTQT